ncbi:MAG: tRNA dihydrouridine(20/20a) synthase DusA [Pseudomonadota bacterium]
MPTNYLPTHYPSTGPGFAIAPMMDWTDRHCRYFHRLMTSQALLYTEMVVADAVIHGDRDYLLGFDDTQHPIALQLGGSDPDKLAQAAKIAADHGYDEVNLNVGCPSDRVQSGTFGACLMREPELVGRCVAAMKDTVSIPVTVKCRIGVDEQDTQTALDNLAQEVWKQGADALWVHARKAWLQGLSPKENRDIPPLDHDRVYRLKQENPNHFIGINGGIESLAEVEEHLHAVDGVMLGRAAYHNPSLLLEVDRQLFDATSTAPTYEEILSCMCDYCDSHLSNGGRLNQITRHMIGLFQGIPGARAYRQILSTGAVKPGAGPEVLHQAFGAVLPNMKSAA